MNGRPLDESERLDWLRLIRSERIGPRTFRALLRQFDGAGNALAALPDLARKSGRGRLRITSASEARREMEAAARVGARFVAWGEPDYPRTLAAIETAPPLLAVRGDVSCLSRPTVAIVGARNASAAGGTFAERLSAELGREGFAIVSGLARGIDTRAHRAAVETGTVAVLAGGLDRVYPPENETLAERIVAGGGAVVSEMPLGCEPRGRDFPRRNRIVSGLSYATVVVEAARRSGSLITARFALEQGREVLAVPGSPLDPRAEGTNDLIRSGAALCSSADHVIAAVAPLLEREPEHSPDGQWREPARPYAADRIFWDELDSADTPASATDDGNEREAISPPGGHAVASLLGTSPVSIDDLVRQAGLPVRDVQLALVELELAGRLERHGRNAVSLRSL